MGVLSWFAGRRRFNRINEQLFVRGDGSYRIDVVGEEDYQEHLHQIVGGHHGTGVEVCATAVLKSENRAVRVDIDRLTVGYLNRSDSVAFHQQIASDGRSDAVTTCSALIVGGWDDDRGRGQFRVRLDFPAIDEKPRRSEEPGAGIP